MSSILRALKKLEEESAPRENEKTPVYRQPGPSATINKFLVALSAFLLVGIIAWLIIQPAGKPVTEKQQETSTALSTPINIQPQAPALEKVSPRESLPEKMSNEQTKPSIGVPQTNGSELPQPVEMEQPIQPVVDKTSDRETKHPVLKLTGILWSEIPGRRLALINDRYLKEGEKINGVKLIRIEEKEVTFQSGAETWTVELGR